MKGHVQDRWYRHKKDAEGKLLYTSTGRPIREKTALYGKGLRYKVHYYDAENKERSRSYPDKAKNKAEDFLTKMQHDVLSGEFVDPSAGEIKFRSYALEWLKGQSADAATRQTTLSKLNNGIFPFLGDKSLRIVANTTTIRNWLDWLEKTPQEGGKGYAASSRSQYFDFVSSILTAAVEDKKVKSNPCASKSIKRPKPEDRKVVPWPTAKIHRVKDKLPSWCKIIVPLGAGAALRQMEIFGLGPDDIDRHSLMLNVRRQIRWIGGIPVFAPPKGGKTRVVPLGQGLLDALDTHMAQFEPVTVTLPWLSPNGRPETVRLLVTKPQRISSARGTQMPPVVRGGWFTWCEWRKAFADAGLVYVPRHDSMHNLRHFCASTWLSNGVSIKEVADYLGHDDPGFTLRTYTHLVPSSYARARAACDLVFAPAATAQAA